MNKNTVILAEKPKQARDDYAPAFEVEKKEKTHYILKPCSTFPDGAILTWAIGHLVELKMPQDYKEEWGKWDLKNLPIIPDKFQFKITSDKKTQFNAIKKLFNEADTIINACDADREGSNIFHSILKMTAAKNKTVKRLWINSLTKKAVRDGFNNLLDDKKDIALYKEAQTRQFADWLVGINTSQLYSLLLQKRGLNTSLSVGRVQTPTVFMIYKRQQEIDNFISKPFYELYADFEHENGNYKGKAKIKTDNKQEIQKLLEDNDLLNLRHNEAIIKNIDKETKETKSPKLYSLSSLQSKSNKKWKYNSSKVLKLMQSLYEKKLLTYPRTETVHITQNEYDYLKKNLESYKDILNVSFENNYDIDKKHIDEKKVQEHWAIIPTDEPPNKNTIEKLSTDEKNIYYEVLKTTLAMFHSNYEYEETKITTDIKGIEFYTKGKLEVKKGWKELFSDEKQEKNDDEEKTDSNNALPIVNNEDLVSSVLQITEGHTTPPKPFTEGTIIESMQTVGKTVEDKGESEILKEVEGIGIVATRSDIIENIKSRDYVVSEKNVLYVTEKGNILCKSVENTLLASPSMTAKWETFLKKIGEGNASQKTFLEKINQFLNSTINEAPKQIITLDTMIKEKNKENEISSCPKCDGSVEDKGKFYGCNSCELTFPKNWAGKPLTKQTVKTLCDSKETKKLKGFKSKKGKSFEAKLILNEEYKITFNFD